MMYVHIHLLKEEKKKEAMKLISADQEPLINLLDAQASLLEGDHEAARRKFEAMLADPEMRLLGLRGLYLEAERLGDRVAARHYATRAVEAAPQLGWAADASLEEKTEAGEWDEALRLVEAQKSTVQIERDAAARRRAVLLTAKALDTLEADPTAAKAAALEAHTLAPALVPAAVAAAKAAFRLGDVRKGAKVLEAAWKQEPHPEIADAYVHARPGDSTHDRLDRAKKLQALRRNHAESALVVARAALDAGEFALARAEAEAAARLSPREGIYLLLADIEEAQTGDHGKVRQWLGMAVRAPHDPAWVADGYTAERWAPISPVTGRLDAFEWRAPGERLGQLLESRGEAVAPFAAPAPLAPPASPAVVSAAAEDAVVEDTAPAAAAAPKDEAVAAREETGSASSAGPAEVLPARVLDAEPPPPAETEATPIRLPDDPGVAPDADTDAEADDGARKFRLF